MHHEEIILLLSSVLGDIVTIIDEVRLMDDFSDAVDDLEAAYRHLEAAFDALDE